MSVTSRTNTLFTLPGVSQYARTGSFNTVIDHLELENNNLDVVKEGQSTKRVCNLSKPSKKVESESKKDILCQKKNKNVNYHELEVQLMMKDRMIEELLEENGKLIENMNKIEQDKIDETNRIQQGTEMILQQVVEDNEWYKAQFLEMKNELEKAISQTRNKGREITSLEKRCKNLIEEKETIQNFLDELTVQYDERIYQLQKHNQNIGNIGQLVKKYLGYSNRIRKHKEKLPDAPYCSISEIIQKIKELLIVENNFSKIKYLVDQIELNALNFEAEIGEILDKINCKNSNNQEFNENIDSEVNLNGYSESVIEKQNDLLNSDFQRINSELESAKSEIKQLKFEIARKAEIIEELKNANKNDKLDILDNINNTKEDSKIKALEEKVGILENEKYELIKKIANINRNNINKEHNINNEYINRKLLVITEEGFSSEININKDIDNNEEDNVPIYNSLNITSPTRDSDKDDKNEINNNEQVQQVSVSDIIDKYIKYPIDYNNGKRQIIQRNSIQRNRYY
ncbi:coiled coil [Cryptosporidium sp. chipmunk genotype I]|uniref:coiled coil n=1 Tax=Cryptosporidium sp. chipmunk genotype I TaxID=1280935 RepID=UPI00351A1C65|nr:coiled coil [Cryptosporidium sp. chipmunk genotype I]